jgi:glycosyltransferase involved in cell wall biosynthesis
MKSISVVIPTYNCGPYIKEAILSVLRQSIQCYEIIVVDDGSTDETRRIVSELQMIHPSKIRYLFQHNQGVSMARNRGINAAHAELIAFLDADDEFGPDFLALAVETISKHHCDIAIPAHYCHKIMHEIGPAKLVIKTRLIWPEDPKSFYCELYKHFIGSIAMLAKRTCFDGCLFDPLVPGGEDYDIWLKLAEKGCVARLFSSQSPQFYYRIRKGSAMNGLTASKRRRYLQSQYQVLCQHKAYAVRLAADLRKVYAEKVWRIGLELLRNNCYDYLGYLALLKSQAAFFLPSRLSGVTKMARGALWHHTR